MFQKGSLRDQQIFIQQKYQEGLQTIRSRMTALGVNKNTTSTFSKTKQLSGSGQTMGTTNSRKNGSTTFLGKLGHLSDQLQEIYIDVQQLTSGGRDLRNSLNWVKDDLLGQCDRSSNEYTLRVEELGRMVRNNIREAEERGQRIQQQCSKNTGISNSIRVNLVQILHRVQSLQNCLGIHTMRDKL